MGCQEMDTILVVDEVTKLPQEGGRIGILKLFMFPLESMASNVSFERTSSKSRSVLSS